MGMCILAGTTLVTAFGFGVAATVTHFWYDFWFGVGWIPGSWLLTTEYAPLVTWSHSAAISTSATWLFTFVVADITPPAISNIGWKTYVVFAVLNISLIPPFYFFYPEMNGKSLEQIDLLFSGPKVHIDLPKYQFDQLQEEELNVALSEHHLKIDSTKLKLKEEHIDKVHEE